MVPYTRTIEFEADAGHNCITLPAPSRGFLNKLIVKQLTGELEGFDFQVYDRLDACSGVAVSSLNPDDFMVHVDPDLHRLIAVTAVSAGTAISANYDHRLAYVNADEQDPYQRRPTTALYLDLNVVGEATKRFAVAISVTTDLG